MSFPNKTSTQSPTPSFNYEVHVKELNERFARLIKQLGPNNRAYKKQNGVYVKDSARAQFEIDFAYAVHEIQVGPTYLQGKMFDNASSVVNGLINHLKKIREESGTSAIATSA